MADKVFTVRMRAWFDATFTGPDGRPVIWDEAEMDKKWHGLTQDELVFLQEQGKLAIENLLEEAKKLAKGKK
jgi:hypothetical protein